MPANPIKRPAEHETWHVNLGLDPCTSCHAVEVGGLCGPNLVDPFEVQLYFLILQIPVSPHCLPLRDPGPELPTVSTAYSQTQTLVHTRWAGRPRHSTTKCDYSCRLQETECRAVSFSKKLIIVYHFFLLSMNHSCITATRKSTNNKRLKTTSFLSTIQTFPISLKSG